MLGTLHRILDRISHGDGSAHDASTKTYGWTTWVTDAELFAILESPE